MIKLQFDFRLISKDNEKIRGRNGSYFLSNKFKQFEEKVRLIAVTQYKDKPLEGNLSIHLVVGFTNKVHADNTNLFKGVCDALQGICYKNDRQIKHSECTVYENEERDSFIIIIEELTMQQLRGER